MLIDDEALIRAVADENKTAARIFVTGEAAESYIGDDAAGLLISINDTLYENGGGCEPLFVRTRSSTIRMTRFNAEFVWRCFHPDTLVDLVQDEADRLGVDVDPWKMDYFDFYQNMITAIKDKSGDAVAFVNERGGLDNFYHEVYLSCLILFGKPGYMDVPVETHFAQKEAADFLRCAEVYRLNEAALVKLEALREQYGGIRCLSNPEMHFVVDLMEKAACG
jgi:hypothetical protein